MCNDSPSIRSARGVARIAPRTIADFVSSSLRRHADRAAILRDVWRQGFFLAGYFLKMLASTWSAMVRRIGPQGGMIIDDRSIGYALSNDGDIHATDQISMVVEKINVRPSEALRDKDRALVGAQDQIDNLGIGYGDLSEGALAINRRREPLGQLHPLFRWALHREWSELIGRASGRRGQKNKKKDC